METIVLTQEMKNRIQIVRTIAIFSVIAIHTVGGNPYEIYLRPFMNFGVGTFLFLSGFLTPEIKDIKAFYKKRILRVLIPYVLWSMLLCLVYGNYSKFWFHLLTFRQSSIYYYIFVYLQITLLAPLLLKIMETRAVWSILLVSPLAIAGESIWAWTGHYLIYPNNINNCLVWMSFFYLGIFFRKQKMRHKISLGKWGIALVFSMILEICEGRFWLSFGREDLSTTQVKLSAMLVTLCVCMLIYVYITHEKQKKQNSRSIRRIETFMLDVGNSSFGIYLIHPVFLYLLKGGKSLAFPISTFVVWGISYAVVKAGQHIFGKKVGKYLGFY